MAFGSSVGHGLPPLVVSPSLVSPLRSVEFVSPLIVSKFQMELCNHPDRAAVSYVLEGLKHGFSAWFFSLFMGAQIFLYEYAVGDSAAFSNRRLSSN